MGPLLKGAVEDLGRLLELDRVSLFLAPRPGEAPPGSLLLRAGWSRDGIPPIPTSLATMDVSLVPRAALEGRPVVSEAASADPALGMAHEILRVLGTDSVLLVPVIVGGRFSGGVAAATVGRRRPWSEEDVAFVESAARHLSAALRQGELVRDLERERDRLRVVAELSAAVQRSETLVAVLDAVVHGLEKTLGFVYGGVALLSDDRKALVIERSFGPDVGVFRRGLRMELEPGAREDLRLAARVLASPDPIVVSDVATHPGLANTRDLLLGIGVRQMGLFPMRASGTTVGLLAVGCGETGRRLDGDEKAILQSAADIVSVAIFQRSASAESERIAQKAGACAMELSRRARVLETVARATQFLSFRLNAPGLMEAFVEEVARALPNADGCVAYVADEPGTVLKVAAAHGAGRVLQAAHTSNAIPADELRCAGEAWRTGRLTTLDVSGIDELMAGADAGARARVKASVKPHDVKHLMAAPVRVGDRRLGVLEVIGCREEGFGPEDGDILAVLAEQSAIALRNARLIEELRASNRLKDDFLATLSHEVRTPLTGIIGWAEVLMESSGGTPDQTRALEAILSQASLLNRLIGDLIDLSRIENVGLDVRRVPVDVSDVVDAAMESVMPAARRRRLDLRTEVDPSLPRLDGDPARLKQVLWNLLSNAVKFSPEGGEVLVSARRDGGSAVVISVADHGIGIDPAFLPHVFERFRQEESGAGRSFGGLGLGLAIARAIVEAHGGTIVAESGGRGAGTVFNVHLPLRVSGVFPLI